MLKSRFFPSAVILFCALNLHAQFKIGVGSGLSTIYQNIDVMATLEPHIILNERHHLGFTASYLGHEILGGVGFYSTSAFNNAGVYVGLGYGLVTFNFLDVDSSPFGYSVDSGRRYKLGFEPRVGWKFNKWGDVRLSVYSVPSELDLVTLHFIGSIGFSKKD